jgi:hypothetical protein
VEIISPEQYFFRHAFGGCYQLLVDGVISSDDYAGLYSLVLEGARPSERLLRTCFPLSSHAIRSLHSMKEVRDYWHHHHTGDGVCTPSVIVPIEQIFRRGGQVFVEVKETKDTVGKSNVIGVEGAPVFYNVFGLPVGQAKHVCVHGPIITEFL